jgi:charged multivesicular body protein 6
LEREHKIDLAAGHKDRALVALRRRKYQEGLLVKTDGQLVALEQLVRTPPICLPTPTSPRLLTCGSAQVSTIEFSLVEVSMLHGLKQGNDVLKERGECGEAAGGNSRNKRISKGVFVLVP